MNRILDNLSVGLNETNTGRATFTTTERVRNEYVSQVFSVDTSAIHASVATGSGPRITVQLQTSNDGTNFTNNNSSDEVHFTKGDDTGNASSLMLTRGLADGEVQIGYTGSASHIRLQFTFQGSHSNDSTIRVVSIECPTLNGFTG